MPITPATFRLDGKIALVTGSSTGIGFAIARGLGEAGATLVLNARQQQRLDEAVAALQADGIATHGVAFDVTDPAAVDAAVATVEAQIGPIDVLVSNAGGTRRAIFTEITMEDWRAVMDTNVDGMFIVGQAVARRMVERGRGRIINICSVTSELGRPGNAIYTTSKGAAKMLTKSMAIDLAPHGVNVNGIGPGYFRTELTAPLVANESFNALLINRTPAKRWGELEDLAPAAVFLASDASRFVAGHILYVDGGVTATL
jgi:gluconate 5-dehydrogenase